MAKYLSEQWFSCIMKIYMLAETDEQTKKMELKKKPYAWNF